MTVSREVQSIVDFVESTGLPYRVTDVSTPGVHAKGSYHYAKGTDGDGLAVDLAGVTPGVTPTTIGQMVAIHAALLLVTSQLAELIYNGPGTAVAVHKGKRVDGEAFYGPATWAAHFNHVHVAVPRGTFLEPLSHPADTVGGGTMPDDNPDLPNITGPVSLHVLQNPAGECTGYIIFSTVTAEIHTYGPGAKYYGRSEVTRP